MTAITLTRPDGETVRVSHMTPWQAWLYIDSLRGQWEIEAEGPIYEPSDRPDER